MSSGGALGCAKHLPSSTRMYNLTSIFRFWLKSYTVFHFVLFQANSGCILIIELMKKYSYNFCNFFVLSGGISICHSNASRSIVVHGDPAFSLASRESQSSFFQERKLEAS